MSKQTRKQIREVCNELAEFLCQKNKAYGDSAINPLRLRSDADALEQILVRQDDKLNRIINGEHYEAEDDMKDLVGYWVLEQVIRNYTPEQRQIDELIEDAITKEIKLGREEQEAKETCDEEAYLEWRDQNLKSGAILRICEQNYNRYGFKKPAKSTLTLGEFLRGSITKEAI